MFHRLRYHSARNFIAGFGAVTASTAFYVFKSNTVLLDDSSEPVQLPVQVNIKGINICSEMQKLRNAVSQLTARMEAINELPAPLVKEKVVVADPGDIVLENKYCRVVYKKRQVCGWTVWVDKRLDWEWVNIELKNDLGHVCRMFPPEAIEAIQSDGRAIWIAKSLSELDEQGNERKQQGACVHYSEEWLQSHGNLAEKKNGGLEIYCWDHYSTWNLHRVDTLLHELSHVYHYLIGFDNTTVLKTFEDAKAAKMYDAVEHCSGEKRKAYAMVNEMEYFASLCVPYFYGRNDYYPFIRPELEKYDPAAFAMLEEVWGIMRKPEISEKIGEKVLMDSPPVVSDEKQVSEEVGGKVLMNSPTVVSDEKQKEEKVVSVAEEKVLSVAVVDSSNEIEQKVFT